MKHFMFLKFSIYTGLFYNVLIKAKYEGGPNKPGPSIDRDNKISCWLTTKYFVTPKQNNKTQQNNKATKQQNILLFCCVGTNYFVLLL